MKYARLDPVLWSFAFESLLNRCWLDPVLQYARILLLVHTWYSM